MIISGILSRVDPLYELIFNRVADDPALPEDVKNLILAAYTSEEQLHAAVAGAIADGPAADDGDRRRPDPLYLERVIVAGFRGIGATASLELPPKAGLTLIVGRNGSGKSSFAEAIELALTGDSARWADRNSVFRQGWRNLHQSSPCQIQLLIRADGSTAPIHITRTWRATDTEPGQGSISVKVNGHQYADTAELGWRVPLETYRPFLTASDLGRLVSSTPSGLFDALAPILGMESLTNADERLKRVRGELDDALKRVKKTGAELATALDTVDDERARSAAAILRSRRANRLDALDNLLADSPDGEASPAVAACRQLTRPSLPAVDDVTALALELYEAVDAAAAARTSRSETAERAARLLEEAVRFHEAHGDGPCPVCRAGTLDATWRSTASAEVGQLRAATATSRAANERLDRARQRALEILRLEPLPPLDLVNQAVELPETERDRLRATVDAWRSISAGAAPDTLAAHLGAAYAPLHEAFTAVQVAAAEWLRRRNDAWRTHAAALQTWLAEARVAAENDEALKRLTTARTWLREATEELRAARLAPFAQQSQHIWKQLRQESNVELSGMQLDGTGTRRRVAFPAAVDGSTTSALAVMSQGELQALGLAVFLPRACTDESPFRFLIIDDPVQSMDPSKVDGLAEILNGLAATRQVVVFTHDNRLPETVRRLQIDATIWEVSRHTNSGVELRKNFDPVARYLDDARAMAKTAELEEAVRGPIVMTLCRSAIEAVCLERIRRERIGRGESHARVEELTESATTTNTIAALALFDDVQEGGRVLPYLGSIGPWAARAFKACRSGAHGDYHGDLEQAIRDTSELVKRLRGNARNVPAQR